MARAHGPSQLFVVPGSAALPTGGNLYNEGLLAALAQHGDPFARASLEQVDEVDGSFERVWVDSLYLANWAALRARFAHASSFALLLHALPSALAHAAGRALAPALTLEAQALPAFDTALATSSTSAEQLARSAPHLRAWVIEPAIQRGEPGLRSAQGSVQALTVANLTPNKGLLPWLRALAPQLRSDDAFTLHCIGRTDLDPDYARACAELVRNDAQLAARVVLTGGQTPREVASWLARAELLVSPSRYESFGMVLADARASGCVVLARDGGHSARLVDPAAGGAVCPDDASLAAALLCCVRDRAELAQRLARAHAQRLAPRSYDDVAREFLAHAARNAQ